MKSVLTLLKKLSHRHSFSLESGESISLQILKNSQSSDISNKHQPLFDFYMDILKEIKIEKDPQSYFEASSLLIEKGVNPVDIDYIGSIRSPNPRWVARNISPICTYLLANGNVPSTEQMRAHADILDSFSSQVEGMPSYGHHHPNAIGVESTSSKLAHLLLLSPTFIGSIAGRMKSFDQLIDAFDTDVASIDGDQIIHAGLNHLKQTQWLYQVANMSKKDIAHLKHYFKTVMERLPGWIGDKSINADLIERYETHSAFQTIGFCGYSIEESIALHSKMNETPLKPIAIGSLAMALDNPSAFCDYLLKSNHNVDQIRQIARQCFQVRAQSYAIGNHESHTQTLLKIAESLHESFVKRGLGGVIGSDILNPVLRSSRIGKAFYDNGYLNPGEPEQTGLFTAMENDASAYFESVRIAGALGKTAFLERCLVLAITSKRDMSHSNTFGDPKIFRQIIEMEIIDLKPILNTPARVKKAISFGATREALQAGGVGIKPSRQIDRKFIESDLDI